MARIYVLFIEATEFTNLRVRVGGKRSRLHIRRRQRNHEAPGLIAIYDFLRIRKHFLVIVTQYVVVRASIVIDARVVIRRKRVRLRIISTGAQTHPAAAVGGRKETSAALIAAHYARDRIRAVHGDGSDVGTGGQPVRLTVDDVFVHVSHDTAGERAVRNGARGERYIAEVGIHVGLSGSGVGTDDAADRRDFSGAWLVRRHVRVVDAPEAHGEIGVACDAAGDGVLGGAVAHHHVHTRVFAVSDGCIHAENAGEGTRVDIALRALSQHDSRLQREVAQVRIVCEAAEQAGSPGKIAGNRVVNVVDQRRCFHVANTVALTREGADVSLVFGDFRCGCTIVFTNRHPGESVLIARFGG